MSESLNSIRSRIESLGMDFQFVKTVKTGANGAERETWLLEYEGSRFIFVSGRKNVTLGWDTDKCPLGDGVLEGLQEEFSSGHGYYYEEELEDLKGDYQERIDEAKENGDSRKAEELRSELAEELESWNEDIEEKGYASWEGFLAKWNEHLSQCLSPLRAADIGDMIVEVDSRYLDEDAPSLEQAVLSLKQGPFTLPTEDEWEYLYRIQKAAMADAPSAAVTGQSMSCPVIPPFIGSPRTSAIWACRKTIFAIGVSSGCRNRFDLADESCRPDEMARTGK